MKKERNMGKLIKKMVSPLIPEFAVEKMITF